VKRLHISLRFIKLEISDYGPFEGHNVIEFDRRRTLIRGECGSGKTTIAKVMYHMGMAPGVIGHVGAFPSVKIDMEGDLYLIEKYRKLIFLDDESARMLSQHRTEPMAEVSFTKGERSAVQD